MVRGEFNKMSWLHFRGWNRFYTLIVLNMKSNKQKQTSLMGCYYSFVQEFLLAYPFQSTVVPEWKIRIVDETGKPVPNVVVREQWRDHSVEFHGHNEERITDSEGYVFFPRRTVRAPLMFRVVGSTLATLNVHGESGPWAVSTSCLILSHAVSSPDYSPDKFLLLRSDRAQPPEMRFSSIHRARNLHGNGWLIDPSFHD